MDTLLRRNWVLQISAFILACILWLAVSTPSGNSVATSAGVVEQVPFSFPVHVQTSHNVVLASSSTNLSATVEVGATFENLIKLPAKMLKVELVANAVGMGPGQHIIHIKALRIPSDVTSYRITPQTVTIVLESRTSSVAPASTTPVGVPHLTTNHKVTFVPEITGTPAPGFAVSGLTINPGNAVVSGEIEALSAYMRVPVDVTGLRLSQGLTLTIPTVPGILKILPNVVRVQVKFAPSAIKTFSAVPVQLTEVPVGVRETLVTPPTVTVSVFGPATVVNALTPADVTAYVVASTKFVNTASQSTPILVRLPSFVSVVQLSSSSAIVRQANSVAK